MPDTDATSQTTFPVSAVLLEPDVVACWDLAGWIGQESSDDHLRSFTSLLIALLHAESPLSKWFLRYARAVGIKVDDIYKARQFHPGVLATIKERQARREVPSGKPAFTASAHNMATGAHDLLSLTTGGTELGIRHLLGSYFYRVPEVHQKQMQEWGFDLQRDGSAFVRQMHERFHGEAETWDRIHIRAFQTSPDLNAKDPLMPPRVSSFAADAPEGEDQLNIEDDVYALSALTCSTRMAPPLSVGLSENRLRTPGVSPGVKAASRRLVEEGEERVCYR